MRVNSVYVLFTFCGAFTFFPFTATSSPKSGLYTTTLLRVKKCEKPSAPYMKDPIFLAFVERNANNRNLIHGNFSILKDTSYIKVNVQDFYSEAGKWQMTINMKNLSCRSHFVADVLNTIDIAYDAKTCAVAKGTYEFEADFNQLDHLWSATREYGKMLRRVEARSTAGTAVCLELEIDVKPAKSNK